MQWEIIGAILTLIQASLQCIREGAAFTIANGRTGASVITSGLEKLENPTYQS
jgi:hypothetical protein